MSHNAAKMLKRRRQVASAAGDFSYEKYRDQKVEGIRHHQMIEAQAKAQLIASQAVRDRVPAWLRKIAMAVLPEWYSSFWLMATASLPALIDVWLRHRAGVPGWVVGLTMLPYNIAGLLLSIIFVQPLKWLRKNLFTCGYRVQFRMSNEPFGIKVILRNFFLWPVFEEFVEIKVVQKVG